MSFEKLFAPHYDNNGIFYREPNMSLAVQTVGLWANPSGWSFTGGPYVVTGGSLLPAGTYVIARTSGGFGNAYAVEISTGVSHLIYDAATYGSMPNVGIWNNKMFTLSDSTAPTTFKLYAGPGRTNLLQTFTTLDVVAAVDPTYSSYGTMAIDSRCMTSALGVPVRYSIANSSGQEKQGVAILGNSLQIPGTPYSTAGSPYRTMGTLSTAINDVSTAAWAGIGTISGWSVYGQVRVDLATGTKTEGALQSGTLGAVYGLSPNPFASLIDDNNCISYPYVDPVSAIPAFRSTYSGGAITDTFIGIASTSTGSRPQSLVGVNNNNFIMTGSDFSPTVSGELLRIQPSTETWGSFWSTPSGSQYEFTIGSDLYTLPPGASSPGTTVYRKFNKMADGSTLAYVPVTVSGSAYAHFVKIHR